MTNDQLAIQFGFNKVEKFKERLTPAIQSSLAGNIVWVHNDFICSKVKKDKSSIQKAIKASESNLSNKTISMFAESIISNEVRHLKSNPDEFLVITSTPYGLYLGFIASI
jgi:hypothetical protein